MIDFEKSLKDLLENGNINFCTLCWPVNGWLHIKGSSKIFPFSRQNTKEGNKKGK